MAKTSATELDQFVDEYLTVWAAYCDNYDRLVEVKDERNPENLFRMNRNITPSGSEVTDCGASYER